MACRVKGDIRRKHAIVADAHFCRVENRAIVVDKRALADDDVVAVIAVKRRIDEACAALWM